MGLVKIEKGEYLCCICKKPFKWNYDSWVFGKAEYKNESDRIKNQKILCSTDCKNKLK